MANLRKKTLADTIKRNLGPGLALGSTALAGGFMLAGQAVAQDSDQDQDSLIKERNLRNIQTMFRKMIETK